MIEMKISTRSQRKVERLLNSLSSAGPSGAGGGYGGAGGHINHLGLHTRQVKTVLQFIPTPNKRSFSGAGLFQVPGWF